MELDDFIESVSGKPLTEQEKALMDEMRAMVADKPFRVLLVDGYLPVSLTDRFFGLAKMDYSKVEERVTAHLLKSRPDSVRQCEKAILFGARYTQCWFDEFEDTIKTKDIPIREVYNFNREVPADHPERKREPKGPRGKWGKLK